MNEYTKHLNRIEFVVTMACTGRCKHCSEGEHRAVGEHIDGEAAALAIKELCENYKIDSLMTFGGEPLLYLDDVCKIHEAAKQMNIEKRELITNGFFTKDKSKIGEAAEKLKESGVTNLLLSVDAFHQETIPLDTVKFFAECIKNTGIKIKVHPAFLVSEEDNNPYNLKTREVLREFTAMGIEISSGNIIFPRGNAVKYLGEYFDSNIQYVNPYEEDPEDLHTVSFSSNGDVLGGNLYKDNILNIINSYKP